MYYSKEYKDVLMEFNSNEKNGLDSDVAEDLLKKNGKNELKGSKKIPFIVKFLLQFKDFLIVILLLAAVVSLIIDYKEWVDSLVIFIVVILNAILGVVQESRAEKSLEALKNMSSPTAKVIRDGKKNVIDSRDLVVGDIVLIDAGDFIPADLRLIDCMSLTIDESALTGESVPVLKHSDVIEGNCPLGDQKNLAFASTYATYGRGSGVVIKTGMDTEVGKIATMISSAKQGLTPLQLKLEQIGKIIGIISLIICAVVFVMEILTSTKFNLSNITTKNFIESFKTAVSLAVAAIPEGLATVVMIILSIGVTKMSKENAIIKKLPAVETLGCTNVICSDKTGTLTQNKMTVVKAVNFKNEESFESCKELFHFLALCSDASISNDKKIGDPTEIALIEANDKYGYKIDENRVGEIAFDSDRKLMTVVIKKDNEYISITKGAPDVIFKLSNANKDVIEMNVNMANEALRVLGLGIKRFKEEPAVTMENLENDLEFVGLVGMIDPERDEVKNAIKLASEASIKTVMITGDHAITAKTIAEKLGIYREGDICLSSEELHNMTDEQLSAEVTKISVYARVAPVDKVRIVEAWQKNNAIVAMTGDGVNDSPALKQADIGCAMGITGTDVAKEASDMILVDDNFSTIISAVKLGRGIYDNIKKCVKYLLSSNIGEVFTIFVASIISAILIATGNEELGVPLFPIHLLWINLITDSLPAFGLGMEKPDELVMHRKPRDKNKGFFSDGYGISIFREGIVIGTLSLVSYLIGHYLGTGKYCGETMAFITLSMTQLFHSYNMKSCESLINRNTFNNRFLNISFIIGTVLQICVVYLPFLNNIFKTTPLRVNYLFISLGLAFCIVPIMEVVKLISKRK